MKLQIAELVIAVCAVVTIGVGLWLYEPWVSLVGVGGIVLALTVVGKLLRRVPRA